MKANYDILLVDDNIHDAELTRRALLECGVPNSLLHLENGVEALDYVFGKGRFAERDVLEMPAVIFLDLKMYLMDGIDVLKEIKSNHQTCQIPVVIFTSSKEANDVSESYRLGANSYAVKPVDYDDFQELISFLGRYWISINQRPGKP